LLPQISDSHFLLNFNPIRASYKEYASERCSGQLLSYKYVFPLALKFTKSFNCDFSDIAILDPHAKGKKSEDYLFPANYDGSTKSYEKYKSLRRRMNVYLKTIAKDAVIEEHFTTYTIRHSWATIAKYMGIQLRLSAKDWDTTR
tara:strand:+ start:133 stop:564 length:432 start_codon:yes stop_codon:yes gene_type:complete